MGNMSLSGLITKKQIETEVIDWQKHTVRLVENVNEYNKQNENRNKNLENETDGNFLQDDGGKGADESTASSSVSADDKNELNIDDDILEAVDTVPVTDEKSNDLIASDGSHMITETTITDVTTSAATASTATDEPFPSTASATPSVPTEGLPSIPRTVSIDEVEPAAVKAEEKVAPKRKRATSTNSKTQLEATTFAIPTKRLRLQCSTAEIATQRLKLASSAARDEALEFFGSLYDSIKGFPMVHEVVESGAAEELVLLGEKCAAQEDVSKRVTTILCNIVLKCDISDKRSVVEVGVLPALCRAVRWKDEALNELLTKSLSFLLTSKTKRFQELAMDSNLYATLIQAFNGGESLHDTHHHIAVILADQVFHKVAPASLRPVMRMLVGLMQADYKHTVVCACNVLTYVLREESTDVILEALRADIVAVIAKLLKTQKLDKVVADRVLGMLENLSVTDENVTIAELVSAEHNLLPRVVSDRLRSHKIDTVLSGLRFFCNVCVSDLADVRQAVADSCALLLLPALPHLQSPPVKELALHAVRNFASGATHAQMQHIMGADGAVVTMLCNELVLGVKGLNDETALNVVFVLQSLRYMLGACVTPEQTNALVALITTTGAMKAIEQLKLCGRKDVKNCACALNFEEVEINSGDNDLEDGEEEE